MVFGQKRWVIAVTFFHILEVLSTWIYVFFVVTAQRSIVKHGDGPIPIPTEWGDDPHFGVGSKLSSSNSSRFIFPLRPDTWQGHCCEIPVPCSRVTAVAYQNDSHDADDDNDGDDGGDDDKEDDHDHDDDDHDIDDEVDYAAVIILSDTDNKFTLFYIVARIIREVTA